MTTSLLAAAESAPVAYAPASDGPWWIGLIPVLPLVASASCLAFLALRVRSKLPAWTVVGLLGASFVVTLLGFLGWNGGGGGPQNVSAFEWIHASWTAADGAARTFAADIGFYMDGLSWLWMLFVTGLATLIGLYASEYMAGDRGYARFFAAFALFVVSMSCLVMGDNLLLLYLGWEGVGLCSYLLIGYFYKKPAAVAAAKKAFIVNRIGDLGLALGLYLTYVTFGTIEYDALFACVAAGEDIAGNALVYGEMWQSWAIPCLLMVGAFGKSAQLPLYVWLPDAMEGPTPVSALIHAATMVTAGVFLIARMYPLFLMDEAHVALTIVAWVGTITALLAATIGMAQFDIKRIMAYSTVSQLGYMFAGLGVLTATGAAFHVFTHAFFKASLFLACGAVMHGFAGQLDLRRLSGLWGMKGWGVVSVCMLVGCLNLAGVPFTAGYFSKDMILAESFVTPGMAPIGWILLFTAGLTAYYTFRVFFRVFVGPRHAEPGDDHHGDDPAHAAHADEGSEDAGDSGGSGGSGHSGGSGGGFHPHAPGWAINTVLAALTVLSLAAAVTYFVDKEHSGWVGGMLHGSSAVFPVGGEAGPAPGVAVVPAAAGEGAEGADGAADHGTFLGFDPHKAMYYVSAVFGLAGILIAAYLHGPRGLAGLGLGGRTEAAAARSDGVAARLGPIPRWAEAKWYVDELYAWLLVLPLRVMSHVFHAFDKLVVDGLVNAGGLLPRALGSAARPSQSGVLQGYAAGMAGGVAVVLIVVLVIVVS